ncbi:hypothetical protein [Natrinema sp. DC36]|uniref:hypothetical protein n=1 Tax=Natrinema sp. DC36 TaxID=2878680 RepID=UPI001CF0CD94|nr:hypothetical protein [Natrinema sp. DC36]
MRQRIVLAAFLLITAVAFLAGFSIIPTSHTTLFILLLGLFAVPLVYALYADVQPVPALIFVVLTPFVPMLLVIDPLEIGLWGHDSYIHSMAALRRITAGHIQNSMQDGSYPSTYLLVDSLGTILGLPLEQVAKYAPLITVTIPLFIYLTTVRWVGRSSALIIAIIAASTRTLIGFETKFVDEILAVTLAFLLIALIPVCRSRAQRLTVIAVMAVLTLSHHAISFLFILGLSLWWISGDVLRQLSQLPVVGQIFTRLAPYRKSTTITLPVVLVSAFFGLIIPLYYGQHFLSLVLINITKAFSGQTSSLSGGGVSTSPDGFFAVASSFLTVSLIVLTLVSIWGVYRYQSDDWEVGWLAFVGCLGILYALSLVAGRVVPLDPIRLLIFIVPLLAAIVVAQLPSQAGWRRSISVIAVAAFLIIPNLAAIPPPPAYIRCRS